MKEGASNAPQLGWWIAVGSAVAIVLLLMGTLFVWLRG